MGNFTKSHNISNRPLGLWRSIHGYGAAHLVNGRLLLSGYDISLHLWRDAKYDGILEANGVPFRIEIKSTGMNSDPLVNPKAEITFTSGGRSGSQISRDAESREKIISSDDADFAIGVSSHDGTLWIVPVELLGILGSKMKIHYSDIFKEKNKIFMGISDTLNSKAIRDGFTSLGESDLEKLCLCNRISITNHLRIPLFPYPWKTSKQKTSVISDYKKSLILDIWKHIFNHC